MFQKISGTVYVAVENACEPFISQFGKSIGKGITNLSHDEAYAYNQTDQHKGGLQCVGEYDRFHTTFEGIQEYHEQYDKRGHRKRNIQVFEDEEVQHIDHQKKPRSCAKRP